MMMEQHENVFGTKKPLIGCLHMAALPGSYYADPTMTYRDPVSYTHLDVYKRQESGREVRPLSDSSDWSFRASPYSCGLVRLI